jgi:tripartite-type tricarboxylate transporter receptor subunit TctC
MNRRRLLAGLLGGVASSRGWAQGSARSVRIMVPAGPGGPTDFMLRTVNQRVEPLLGQQMVLEYKPGAAGITAIQAGLSLPADGGALIGVFTSLAFNPTSFSRLPYDTFRDLDPVSLLVNIPLILAAGPQLPVGSVQELIDWGRANPGKLTIGASGLGGGSHLGGLMLGMATGLDLTIVPYKGGADALPDLVSGRISLMLDSYQTLKAQADSGRIRLLGVASPKRQEFAPGLPAIAETVPGYSAAAWQGLAIRAGTPVADRDRIAQAYADAMRDPGVRATLIARGFEPVGSSAAEFAAVLRSDIETWRPVIRKAGLKND